MCRTRLRDGRHWREGAGAGVPGLQQRVDERQCRPAVLAVAVHRHLRVYYSYVYVANYCEMKFIIPEAKLRKLDYTVTMQRKNNKSTGAAMKSKSFYISACRLDC